MPSIRELVEALGRREEVDAAVLLGHDGLPIDSQIRDGLDAELLAALIPAILRSCETLGESAGRGGLRTGVLEFASGRAVVANLSPTALLLLLVRPHVNLGPLLYDIRRHRVAMTTLL